MMVVMQDLLLLAGKMREYSEDDRIRPASWLVRPDLLAPPKGYASPCNWRLGVRDRSPSGGGKGTIGGISASTSCFFDTDRISSGTNGRSGCLNAVLSRISVSHEVKSMLGWLYVAQAIVHT